MERKISGTWAPLPPPKNENFEEACEGKDLTNPTNYHPKKSFTIDQVIQHVKFGIGIVMGIKDSSKIIVVFKDGVRKLVQAPNQDQ